MQNRFHQTWKNVGQQRMRWLILLAVTLSTFEAGATAPTPSKYVCANGSNPTLWKTLTGLLDKDLEERGLLKEGWAKLCREVIPAASCKYSGHKRIGKCKSAWQVTFKSKTWENAEIWDCYCAQQ